MNPEVHNFRQGKSWNWTSAEKTHKSFKKSGYGNMALFFDKIYSNMFLIMPN